ncbi:MAG: DUF1743 domain-containing protein [Nitrososphaerales archaeon]
MYKSTNAYNNILHIGFDDTDSRSGRCTTYLAFKILSNLKRNQSIKFLDYPLLIRLNPNIPWKTRGNGAVCIRLTTRNSKDIERITEYIKNEIEQNSDIGIGANPGLVFFEGRKIPDEIIEFNRIAMFDILSKQKAIKIAEKNKMKFFCYGNGQGLVGATAAIGCLLDSDYTFEVIAYRKIENCQTPRKIDSIKVIYLDRSTFPSTFNCYDHVHERILITPHGPDPVFCGIRGEDPEIVLEGLKMLKIVEKLEGYLIYRSNQGTGMHLINEIKLGDVKAYTAGISRCRVTTNPYTMQGGHVFFTVEDDSKNSCLAAVYEPTGLTKVAAQLQKGDLIEIGFGVRKATIKHPTVLNLEYISILETIQIYELVNPTCVNCGKRMKSEGKEKGFQCKRCKTLDRYGKKVPLLNPRSIKEGLYVPTPKAHRHLTKPRHRYGMEKKGWDISKNNIFPKWFGNIDNI